MQNKSRLLLLIFALVVLVSPMGFANNAPLLRVTYLNVGQGDAILVRTAEKTILIDAGDDRSNAGNGVIVPYLKKEGIRRIDTAVLSHPHRDHFGGYIDVINAIEIGEFLFSSDTEAGSEDGGGGNEALLFKRMLDAIKAKNIPYIRAQMGMKLDWGKGIKTELLHVAEPKYESGDPLKSNQNENSLVIKVTAGKISYLFTGDAERGAEESTIAMSGGKLKSTVLKAGHHGSKTSSSHPFLELVKPQYAVVSVGRVNSFGHPSPQTLEKFAYYKTKVFRTDQDGTIDSFTDGQTVKFVSNSSALELTKKPEVIALTANSATLQWETNKTSNSILRFGTGELNQEKVIDSNVKVHTVTVSGLQPNTAYRFQAASVDERQPDQVVTAEGTFTTPAGTGVDLPRITGLVTSTPKVYMRKPFVTKVTVANPAAVAQTGLSVDLYHSALDPKNLLGQLNIASLAGNKTVVLDFPTEISWMGSLELLAVLRQNKTLLDTASLQIDVLPKIVLVDCAHGNKDYFTGRFAGMKMDLDQNLGITMKSISKPFTPELLGEAFMVIIPEQKDPLAATELAALKDFTRRGGSVLLFLKSDFRDASVTKMPNAILQAIGSTIRFNDDQFCDPTDNIGPPWRAWVKRFPAPFIQGVDRLLVRSSCTLINHKMEGLAASKNVHLLATGDDDSFNSNSDGLDDGYIYASHTPLLPIPVVAGEDLGSGRVVCYGEGLYDDSLYHSTSTIPTPLFNRQVCAWLTAGKDKTVRQLLASAADLETLDDLEVRADRFGAIANHVQELVSKSLAEEPTARDDLRSAFAEQGDAAPVQILRTMVDTMLEFNEVHEPR
jgi:competence protein ComEC